MIDFDALVVGPTVSTFGQSVTYQPMLPLIGANGMQSINSNGDLMTTPGTPYAASGVFDAEFIEVTPLGRGPFVSSEAFDIGASGGISEARPVLGVQLSSMLSTPSQGDQVTIGAVKYDVKEVQPDGHGWAKLLLNIAP